jgi:hypothetical protein
VDDRRPHSLAERIRSERRLGIAYAVAVGVVIAAVLAIDSLASALTGLLVIPLLVALRELLDLERANRRAWRKAISTLPPSIDHALLVRGIARPLDQRVVAPYSLRECLAYRARFTGDEAAELRERVADLIVVVGDAKILIEGDSVQLACDPCAGDAAPVHGSAAELDVFVPMTRALAREPRHQEVLLLPGDDVVVDGYLLAERQRGATHRLALGGTLVIKPAQLSPATPLDADGLAKLPKVRARPYRAAG